MNISQFSPYFTTFFKKSYNFSTMKREKIDGQKIHFFHFFKRLPIVADFAQNTITTIFYFSNIFKITTIFCRTTWIKKLPSRWQNIPSLWEFLRN